MQMKVGALARSSGLTVRTLHHYDEIGLLRPSGRSEAGYRLYSEDDVGRLHAIQAMRQLGLPLADIGGLLDGRRANPALVLEQQMHALERQIAQASELRDRLALIRDGMLKGQEPDMDDWLQSLGLMATFGRYFSAAELKTIFGNWHRIETPWLALMQEVQLAMREGATPDSARAQSLARRWMALVHHWMDGDFGLIRRWGAMYRAEPGAHGRGGGPPSEMFIFMQATIDLRMAVMLRHFSETELHRVRAVPEDEWLKLNDDGLRLLQSAQPACMKDKQTLLNRWLILIERLMGGDAALGARLIAAQRAEPLLRTSSAITAPVWALLMEAYAALDPHPT